MYGGENLFPRRPVRKAGLQKASLCGDIVGVGQQRPAGRTAVKVHLLLDSLPQVLHDMKPVGDLFRLRRALPGSLGVETAAISADHFHLGMSFQPVGAGDHITIFENIDDRATLQIDNDRAVGLRLPPAPVVDPDDGRRLGSVLSTVLQLPKHRVITDPKAQAVQEPLGRPPAGRVPKMADNFPDTRSAPRKRTRNRADLVRESPARAGGCQTSPTANPEGYRNPVTMGGIILQPPTPPAVTTSRLQSTVWADAVWCQTAGYSPPAGIAPLNALNGNIAPGRPVLP